MSNYPRPDPLKVRDVKRREIRTRNIREHEISEGVTLEKVVQHGDSSHSVLYQQRSERGQANGYPSLDSAAEVVEPATKVKSGTDADKTPDPVVGDIYAATDTSKLYVCFATGVWTAI